MNGWSTSSAPGTRHPKQGIPRHASSNNSPTPHYYTTYKHPKVVVTRSARRKDYYLQATYERSPIAIYTFPTCLDLKPPRHHPRPMWRHPLHAVPDANKRPTHHACPPTDHTTLLATCRRAMAQHQSRHHGGHPQMHPEPTGPAATTHNGGRGGIVDLPRQVPHSTSDAIAHHHPSAHTTHRGPFQHVCGARRYGIPMHPCNPRCALLCTGTLHQPLPTPTYLGGSFLGTIPGDPNPYLLPGADQKNPIRR